MLKKFSLKFNQILRKVTSHQNIKASTKKLGQNFIINTAKKQILNTFKNFKNCILKNTFLNHSFQIL